MPDLDWTLSVPLRRSWAEVCRWITSLAGGSSCRGNVGWLDVAPSIQLSLRLKRHLKWCATAIRVVITILSVSARRSVELDDDKVVSEYEEDWPEGGIGSAIRVSCPSYLEPSWQLGMGRMRCEWEWMEWDAIGNGRKKMLMGMDGTSWDVIFSVLPRSF